MSHVYCPQCGFLNPEAANFCAKCAALLVHEEAGSETTVSLTAGEVEEADLDLGELGIKGPALIVRAGGGLAGAVFPSSAERMTIGRSPDCDVFLDDVTVSRRHAVLIHDGPRFVLQDQGSLNGTFLNRSRIESAELADGDEVQIGKYRLTFLT
ncbi:MAG: FHA domain-containing protein [Gaiellaceae bacterium]